MKKLNASALIIFALVIPGHASPVPFQLCSPRNGDHFEVAKPLLFWQSSVGSVRYEVFVDGARIDEVPAAPMPVFSYASEIPLGVGSHSWFVKALAADGSSMTSSNFSFTIDASTNWPAWAIGPFVRYGNNPVLKPVGTGWEARNTYNPGVLFDDGRFLMLYRGQGKKYWTSREGFAESLDGVTFLRNAVPVIDAIEPFESKYGCEDARLIKYQGVYYSFYTGNSSNGIALCEATSTNCINWKKLGVIETGTKNGAIVRDPFGVPVKINGKFVMFTGNSKFGVCYSDDLMTWGPITWIDLKLPAGWTTPYEPCVAIADYSASHPENIVLFIAGTLNGKDKWFYAISEVLLSKADLTRKIDQLDDCIMKPAESYESGQFTNCLWMNSIVLHNGQWWMHYGAGDRNVGLATAPLKK